MFRVYARNCHVYSHLILALRIVCSLRYGGLYFIKSLHAVHGLGWATSAEILRWVVWGLDILGFVPPLGGGIRAALKFLATISSRREYLDWPFADRRAETVLQPLH